MHPWHVWTLFGCKKVKYGETVCNTEITSFITLTPGRYHYNRECNLSVNISHTTWQIIFQSRFYFSRKRHKNIRTLDLSSQNSIKKFRAGVNPIKNVSCSYMHICANYVLARRNHKKPIIVTLFNFYGNVSRGLCYKTTYSCNLQSFDRKNMCQCYKNFLTVIWPYYGEFCHFYVAHTVRSSWYGLQRSSCYVLWRNVNILTMTISP